MSEQFNPSSIPKSTEEGRYSFGTTPAIDRMLDIINKRTSKTGYDIFINVDTLVRNRWNKNLKIPKIGELVAKDMQGIINDLADAMMLADKNHYNNIHMYSLKYEQMIPTTYLRKSNSELHLKSKEVLVWLNSHINFDATAYPNIGNTSIKIYFGLSNTPSYKQLREDETMGNPYVMMLSHQALDYHIFNPKVEGCIVRSFLGTVMETDRRTLGQHVFKVNNIPFYPMFHVLFGDKELIQGSILKDKEEKKRMLDIADTYNWSIRTRSYLLDSIKKNNFVLPYSLD